MRGEQAMLFLNRRGYAPLTLCEACGHKMTCKQCSSWLVEHRYHRRLMCHHCGYSKPRRRRARNAARRIRLIACGPGVERVAEEFASVFPRARLAIASSDTMHGPLETQAAIRAMQKHEIDVVIGTQIVAKGHHFPQLTLVGVVDADLGGSDGDLRARERTFQLLHQVSGRAGRAEKPGLVLIQTRNPDDAVMQALASGDRDSFYDQEAKYRERAGAPPFGRLAAIILSGHDGEAVQAAGRALAQRRAARERRESVGPDAGLLSPAARPNPRAPAGAGGKERGCAGLSARLAGRGEAAKSVRVPVDIDPVSFF